MSKKHKVMILCTGIEAVGCYDGEFKVNLLPHEAVIPGLVAKHGSMIAIKSRGEVFVSGNIFAPYSYTLSHSCGDQFKSLARCLVKLGFITKKSLEARFSELAAQDAAEKYEEKAAEFGRICDALGIQPTIRQMKSIRKCVKP